jgi:hypothetical protein
MQIHFSPQRKQPVCMTTTSWFVLFSEIITLYYENYIRPTNKYLGKMQRNLMSKQMVYVVHILTVGL